MLLLRERAGIQETSNGPFARDHGGGLAQTVRDDDEEDGIDIDGLGLEVEDFCKHRAKGGQTQAEEKRPERVWADGRIIRDIESLGDQLKRGVEFRVGSEPYAKH